MLITLKRITTETIVIDTENLDERLQRMPESIVRWIEAYERARKTLPVGTHVDRGDWTITESH